MAKIGYSVLIRRNSDGEERLCPVGVEWGDSSLFWWTEGNMGCDCNRYLYFERAGGNEPEWHEGGCGNEAYTAVHAELQDGTIIELSKPQETE